MINEVYRDNRTGTTELIVFLLHYCNENNLCLLTEVGENYMYTNFLKSRTCYDIMPKSSKIVVFDIKLRVSKVQLVF